MKINDKMKIRDMMGEHIIIMQGADAVDMTRVVALNDTALFLYNNLSGRDFELDDAVRLLTDHYAVADDVALRDAERLLADMKKNNIVV